MGEAAFGAYPSGAQMGNAGMHVRRAMAKRRTETFSGCTGLLYVAERAVTMADLRSTTAIILAGGLGTRLRPVVSDRPKVLAEVAGRPFLAYLLEQVAAAGVRRLVLCTGYRAEAVEAAFGRSFAGMHLLYSPEVEPLGTGGALRQALTLAESDPVLAMNGDSYLDMPLAAISARHDAHGGEGTVAVTRVPDTGRFGCVRTAEDGRILAFEERGTRGQAGWINAGIICSAVACWRPFRRRARLRWSANISRIGLPPGCTPARANRPS